MLRAVVKKELLGHLVSFRFHISTFILLVLAALAASVGTRDFQQRQTWHQERTAKHGDSLISVHVYSQLHPQVARAPEPLSVLHRGFDARLGAEVQLDIFSIPSSATADLNGDLFGSAFRDFDLTTIVRVVLGLLALLLTFDAVVGEREKGTLRLIFANGIPRSTLIAGKYLGALFALLVPLLLSTAVSLWIVLTDGGIDLDSQRLQRVVGLVSAYAIYLSVMLWLGLALSTAAKTTAGALVYSLLGWLAIVFLIPQAAVAIAGVDVHKINSPTDPEFNQLIEQRDQELFQLEAQSQWKALPAVHKAPVVENNSARGVFVRFGSARYYDARVDFHIQETAIGMAYAERIFDAERQFEAGQRRAESLAWVLAAPSPAFLLERVAASYAGTSLADHDGFLEDCREFRRSFIGFLERRGAFKSWQWFTDDPPKDLRPWTGWLGVAPEAVEEEQVQLLMKRWTTDENQSKVRQAKLDLDADSARRLELQDLPTLQRRFPGFWHACRRVLPEIFLLLLGNGLLAGVVWRRFAEYPLR